MNHVRSYSGGAVTHGMVNGKLANPNLGWESTATYNAGLDLGFIDNRFRVTMNVYQRTTKDMLMNFWTAFIIRIRFYTLQYGKNDQ